MMRVLKICVNFVEILQCTYWPTQSYLSWKKNNNNLQILQYKHCNLNNKVSYYKFTIFKLHHHTNNYSNLMIIHPLPITPLLTHKVKIINHKNHHSKIAQSSWCCICTVLVAGFLMLYALLRTAASPAQRRIKVVAIRLEPIIMFLRVWTATMFFLCLCWWILIIRLEIKMYYKKWILIIY